MTTVSHMLSGKRRVSARTRLVIQAAIDELNFNVNETARALRTQQSHNVALILDNIAHESNPLFARGAGEVFRAHGYTMVIYETNADAASLGAVLDSIGRRGADAAIVNLPGERSESIAPLVSLGCPIVYAGPPNASWPAEITVSEDESLGIEIVTKHVMSLTDAPLAFIGGPRGDANANVRHEAFVKTVTEGGRPLDVRQLAFSDWSFLGGKRAVGEILATVPDVAGIVCANDLIAIGAIHGAEELGRDVPRDLIITGYDNIEAASMVRPSLTTVEKHATDFGRLAALKVIGDGAQGSFNAIAPELIVRASTAGPS